MAVGRSRGSGAGALRLPNPALRTYETRVGCSLPQVVQVPGLALTIHATGQEVKDIGCVRPSGFTDFISVVSTASHCPIPVSPAHPLAPKFLPPRFGTSITSQLSISLDGIVSLTTQKDGVKQ